MQDSPARLLQWPLQERLQPPSLDEGLDGLHLGGQIAVLVVALHWQKADNLFARFQGQQTAQGLAPGRACTLRDGMSGDLEDASAGGDTEQIVLRGSSDNLAQLFVAELIGLRIATFVALTFTLAMLLLIAALVSFIVEVRTSLLAVKVREELIGGR